MATPLTLKRAPIGDNRDDYDVLEDGVIVGRTFKVPIAPVGSVRQEQAKETRTEENFGREL